MKGSRFFRCIDLIPTENYRFTSPKTNMTMETPPFEDVFPIENCDFPMSC